ALGRHRGRGGPVGGAGAGPGIIGPAKADLSHPLRTIRPDSVGWAPPTIISSYKMVGGAHPTDYGSLFESDPNDSIRPPACCRGRCRTGRRARRSASP